MTEHRTLKQDASQLEGEILALRPCRVRDPPNVSLSSPPSPPDRSQRVSSSNSSGPPIQLIPLSKLPIFSGCPPQTRCGNERARTSHNARPNFTHVVHLLARGSERPGGNRRLSDRLPFLKSATHRVVSLPSDDVADDGVWETPMP